MNNSKSWGNPDYKIDVKQNRKRFKRHTFPSKLAARRRFYIVTVAIREKMFEHGDRVYSLHMYWAPWKSLLVKCKLAQLRWMALLLNLSIWLRIVALDALRNEERLFTPDSLRNWIFQKEHYSEAWLGKDFKAFKVSATPIVGEDSRHGRNSWHGGWNHLQRTETKILIAKGKHQVVVVVTKRVVPIPQRCKGQKWKQTERPYW